jgi:hypothetical protein
LTEKKIVPERRKVVPAKPTGIYDVRTPLESTGLPESELRSRKAVLPGIAEKSTVGQFPITRLTVHLGGADVGKAQFGSVA